jgi:hypothetical protein
VKGLRIFEKHPEADAYKVGPSYAPYALVARANRFTDAELAAEYFAAMHKNDMDWVQTGIDDPKMKIITDTMRRFATLPHFDGAS